MSESDADAPRPCSNLLRERGLAKWILANEFAMPDDATLERADGGNLKSRPVSESTTAIQNAEIRDEETEQEKFKAGFFDKDPYTSSSERYT